MKFATRILSLVVLASAALFYTACDGGGGGDNQSEQQVQFNKLKGTWTLESATLASEPKNNLFANVKLELALPDAFQENGVYFYKVTGTRPNPSPWPQDGSWRFGTNPSTQIIRDPGDANDEILMEYQLNGDATTLTLNFSVTGDGWAGGKTKSVEGEWEFVFKK